MVFLIIYDYILIFIYKSLEGINIPLINLKIGNIVIGHPKIWAQILSSSNYLYIFFNIHKDFGSRHARGKSQIHPKSEWMLIFNFKSIINSIMY